MKAMSKTVAISEAQRIVSKLIGHGTAGHGKQWTFRTPAFPAEIRINDGTAEYSGYYHEKIGKNYNDIRFLRGQYVAAVAMRLMGWVSAEEIRAAIETVIEMNFEKYGILMSANAIVNAVCASGRDGKYKAACAGLQPSEERNA